MGTIYGYVRVSTKEQNEERQMVAMRQFGVPEKCIIVEKQSGRDFDRPRYLKLVKGLRPGDTLVIKSIDRLGRDYTEILEQWARITKQCQAAVVVLDMPLLDTREGRDLTGTLIADIVLQLLSYVAQTEREFLRQRQAEGIEAARAKGVHIGRVAAPLPDCFEDAARMWWAGEISSREAAELLDVSYRTFLRQARRWGDCAGFAGQRAPKLKRPQPAGRREELAVRGMHS